MTLYPKLIIDALATVMYAGTKKNLVESQMVADQPAINGNQVTVVLEFPRDTDPFLKSTVKAAEAAIKYHCGQDVEVTIKTEFKSAPRPEVEQLLPGVKNIIAVSSGKGGVGKSTVSANLAIALARLGYKVGLLDCDIFGPSMPKMFNVEDERPYAVKVDGRDLICPIEQYGVKMLSIGFFVSPTTATLWRGGMATSALKQLIADADWGELDYFILDTPPGTSDIHLTLLQTLPITGAVIVSTPQPQRESQRAHPRTDREHGVVHTRRTARQPLLHLRARGLQAAGRGDAGTPAGSDTARTEHLRQRRPRHSRRPQQRNRHGTGLPEPCPGRRHRRQPPQPRAAQDQDCWDEQIEHETLPGGYRLCTRHLQGLYPAGSEAVPGG